MGVGIQIDGAASRLTCYLLFLRLLVPFIYQLIGLWPQICINIHPDVVPPIHAVSYHVATDKSPAKNGDKFRFIFSDNLQPIATRGKKARGTLLVDHYCGNGCSIKRAPLSASYYNEISGGHIGRGVVRRRCSAGPVLPLWVESCPFLCLCVCVSRNHNRDTHMHRPTDELWSQTKN